MTDQTKLSKIETEYAQCAGCLGDRYYRIAQLKAEAKELEKRMLVLNIEAKKIKDGMTK